MKTKLLGIALTLIISCSIVFSILLFNKYKSFSILSIKKEYNLVVEDENDTLSIPLYLEKTNSFISSLKEVSSVSISNDEYIFKGKLKDISKEDYVIYNDSKYYEYDYVISFLSYDSFGEPIFIENAKFNILYNNSEKLSFDIGNMCIFFNSDLYDPVLTITDLSTVCNVIDNIDTIVGINITIRSNASNLKINNIKIKNKFYDLDNSLAINTTLERRYNLLNLYTDYSYVSTSIDSKGIDKVLPGGESLEIFIPIRYIGSIKNLESFPIYISYTRDGIDGEYIMNDFLFMNRNKFYSRDGINIYEYNYS